MNKATCFGEKLLANIRPNYKNTKGGTFYNCMSGFGAHGDAVG